MAVHLRAALARLPGLEKNPCISTAPVFKEISQKELHSNKFTATRAVQALWVQAKCEHILRFWKGPRVPPKVFTPVSYALHRPGRKSSGTTLQSCHGPRATISKLPKRTELNIAFQLPFHDLTHNGYIFFSPTLLNTSTLAKSFHETTCRHFSKVWKLLI